MRGWPRAAALCCAIALVSSCDSAPVSAPTPSPVIARVGTTAITQAELDVRVQSTLTQVQQAGGQTNIPAMQAAIRTRALQSLILDAVIAQEAAAKGLAATPAEVQQQVNADAHAVGGMSALQTQLAEAGGSIAQLEDEIRSGLNEERLEDAFAKDRAALVEQQLHAGANFADEAKAMSDDNLSSAKGGDLGAITSADFGNYDTLFIAAMQSLSVGAYTTTPVRDAGGYDILMVYARSGSSWSVRHILVAAPRPYTVKNRPAWFGEALFATVAQLCANQQIHVYIRSAGDPCSGAPSFAASPSPSP